MSYPKKTPTVLNLVLEISAPIMEWRRYPDSLSLSDLLIKYETVIRLIIAKVGKIKWKPLIVNIQMNRWRFIFFYFVAGWIPLFLMTLMKNLDIFSYIMHPTFTIMPFIGLAISIFVLKRFKNSFIYYFNCSIVRIEDFIAKNKLQNIYHVGSCRIPESCLYELYLTGSSIKMSIEDLIALFEKIQGVNQVTHKILSQNEV